MDGRKREMDGQRAIHGRATDKIRAGHGLKNGRTTIRGESWKLDARLLEAAGKNMRVGNRRSSGRGGAMMRRAGACVI